MKSVWKKIWPLVIAAVIACSMLIFYGAAFARGNGLDITEENLAENASISGSAGALICVLLRRKLTARVTVTLYVCAALLSGITLLFTPYNLQLAAPAANLQNISTIDLILLIFLGAVNCALLVCAVGAHIAEYMKDGALAPLVAVAVCAAAAATLALLAAKYDWRFPVCSGVYAGVLFVLGTSGGFCLEEEEARTDAPVKDTRVAVVCAVVIALTVGVAAGGYFL